MHRLRINLPIKQIVKRYLAGESINSLAKSYSVTRNVVTRRLIRANIKLRTQSEAEKLKWSHLTPEQRKHQLKAAHDSVRGKRKNRDFLIRKAKGVQEKAKLSRLERLFLEAFAEARIKVTPQYALDIFNIDFAIPISKVAIEIDGGNWHESQRKIQQDQRKEEFLQEHGWDLIRLQKRDLKNCVQRVKSLL